MSLNELENIINQLGIKIRYEKGDFFGGYCLLKDEKIIVVNKKLDEKRKINILASSIYEFGIDEIEMKPEIKNFIQDEIFKNKVL